MYPYQPYFNQQTQYQRTEVVKVNGEGGAKAYQMPPNSSVLLLDETAPIVWLKTTDGAGFPSLSPYSITPYKPAPPVDVNGLEQRIARNDRLTNIGNGICDSTFALNNAITTEGRNLSNQLANCCCEQRLGIANLSAQMNQNTCDITTAIHAEAEATRSLIQANEMQALRDKVSSLEMDNRMYGVVRYPNGYTYNAGNSPFCGNNCGCCC